MAQNIVDADFTGVTSVERVITNGNNIVLGTQAQRAGVDTVINTNSLPATLTLNAGFTRDNGSFTLGVNTLDTVILNNQAAGTTYRATFTSAEVGNANVNDGTATAPQDGGLAVRLQKEDASDALVGGVSRFSDEGVEFVSGDATVRFDVRDISGTQRGTFQQVILGTAGADVTGVVVAAGVAALAADAGVYINGGEGNDFILGSANTDFLVGGKNDDTIFTGGGNDAVLGGAGNDNVTETAAGLVNIDAGAGDDTVDMNSFLAATGLAATRDTVNGGDGTNDILASTNANLRAAAVPANGDAASITNFEILRVTDAGGTGAATLTTANVQAGIRDVNFSNAATAANNVAFEAGTHTLSLGAVIGGVSTATQATGAIVVSDTGTATTDALTIANTNGAAGGVDALNGQLFTVNGFETVTINTGANNGTNVGQTATLTVTPDGVNTPVSLAFAGSNSFTTTGGGAGLITVATLGNVTANASGLTAQPGAAQTFNATFAALPGAATLTFTGSAGNDTVIANSAANLTGGDGADTIAVVGSSNDTLSGGAGNDTINGGAGNDNIMGDAGNDRVLMGANLTANDTVNGGDGDADTLVVNAAVGGVHVTAAQQVNVSGFEVIELAGDATAGAQATTQDLTQFVNNTGITGLRVDTDGADSVAVTGMGAALTAIAVDGSLGAGYTFRRLVDTTTNTANLTVINGAAGAPQLLVRLDLVDEETITLRNANAGANAATDERYVVGTLNAGDATSLTLTGTDSVQISALNLAGTARNVDIDVSGVSVSAAFPVQATGAAVTLVNAAVGINAQIGTNNVNINFTGTQLGNNGISTDLGNDTITGGSVADAIFTGAGRDSIVAGAGDDLISGGAGADNMNGGIGSDTFVIGSRSDTRDLVAFSKANTTNANIDSITDFLGNGAAAGDTIQLGIAANQFGAALQFTATTTANVVAQSVAAADSFNQLESLFVAAASTTGAGGVANVIDLTIVSGSLAGRYLFINDEVAAVNFDLDTIINITGVSGTLNAQDFMFA